MLASHNVWGDRKAFEMQILLLLEAYAKVKYPKLGARKLRDRLTNMYAQHLYLRFADKADETIADHDVSGDIFVKEMGWWVKLFMEQVDKNLLFTADEEARVYQTPKSRMKKRLVRSKRAGL